jgi:hypothetical protein
MKELPLQRQELILKNINGNHKTEINHFFIVLNQ